MMDKLPSTFAFAVARNFTLKLRLWLGARLKGGVAPAMLNPGPLIAACATSTAMVLTFVTVTICAPVLPTGVLTDRLLGLTVRGGAG